ncbi:zinc finger BED domain-containing protein RICESLEEPER 2-like [Iris pallida]|uniref:Zinc finger BED domain-containing protein RICESLEEPER 2-like n=1 Tax=Iris pallida TaxID=29817 RepID=A0AAX6GBW1_IRIPA|nr:zinc finger BED domain-containing protein RICESLEEPER 2-like [Iris pallida]
MSEITEMDVSNSNALAVSMSGDPKTTRRLRSLVWNDFTKEKKPDGNCVAICNHCKKQLTASSRSGTTHLKNHLVTCTSTKVRVKRRKLVVRRLGLKFGEGKHYGNDGIEGSNFDQEMSRKDLARMVVFHGYPFTIVRHAGFRTFVKNLQPQFKLIPDDVVRDDCMKIYEDGRVKLRDLLEKLPCRVSLTVDMWRSREDAVEDYMCLTCHYVDNDWKLKSKILNFLHAEDLTSGEEISKTIVEKLNEWNISRKLFSITLDNLNDHDVVTSELLKFVQPLGSLPLNGDLFHVQGAAYVLNLIAQDFMMLARDIISRVRDSVQHVRSSLDTLNEFQKHVERVGAPQRELVLDVSNDLSSTYLMLETAYEFQGAFTCFAEDDDGYVNSLSPEDWTSVRAVTDCLYAFYQAIAKFSGARIPTANLYFNEICDIHWQLVNWSTSSVTLVASVASQILGNFEQYWSTTRLVMAIASILDPRYKMRSIEYFFKQIYGDTYETNEKIGNIRKCLANLYNEYVVQSNHLSKTQEFLFYSHTSDGATATTESKTDGESKTISRFTLSDAKRGLDQYLQETSSSQPQKSDLDLYLDEAVDRTNNLDDNFNILAWWKFYAAKYPVLSTMACDILAIPASSSSLDIRSRTLDENLRSLDPMTVQGLKCGQDWLKEEFEVHIETPASADGVVTVPLTANLGGDVGGCTIRTTDDDFILSHN